MKTKFALKIRRHNASIGFEIKKSNTYVSHGDHVVVNTNRGEELGQVVKLPVACAKHGLHAHIDVRDIVRVATAEDMQVYNQLPDLEQDYLEKINAVFEQDAQNAKVINCELLFGKKLLIVNYRLLEADQKPQAKGKKKKGKNGKPQEEEPKNLTKLERKDMSKKLYSMFGLNIDLKEMANRSCAYPVGGLGHCGMGMCCTNWMQKPKQVSIKMAKEQNLSINIPKLSGVCGKLMCCIAYEQDQYERGVLQDKVSRTKDTEDEFGFIAK